MKELKNCKHPENTICTCCNDCLKENIKKAKFRVTLQSNINKFLNK